MPTWKIVPPAKYPAIYGERIAYCRDKLLGAPDGTVLAVGVPPLFETEAEARKARNRLANYKRCVLHYPAHPLATVVKMWKIEAKVRETADGWELYIKMQKPSLVDDIINRAWQPPAD